MEPINQKGAPLEQNTSLLSKWARKKGLVDIQCGSVTVVQRFGSALNLNVHFHALVIDGVYDVDDRTGQLRFYRAKEIGTTDVEDLIVRIAEKCGRWLYKQDFGRKMLRTLCHFCGSIRAG